MESGGWSAAFTPLHAASAGMVSDVSLALADVEAA
jgi:hypothetical protein